MLFESERVIVWEIRLEDFEDIMELFNDDQVLKYEVDLPQKEEDIQYHISQVIENYEQKSIQLGNME